MFLYRIALERPPSYDRIERNASIRTNGIRPLVIGVRDLLLRGFFFKLSNKTPAVAIGSEYGYVNDDDVDDARAMSQTSGS